MIIRLLSGTSLSVLELQGVSQVVIESNGTVIACAGEIPGGSLVSKIGDSDFPTILRQFDIPKE